MDEEVDVVNEADEIIGSALKSECHAQGLLHRGASVLVFKDSSFKKVLIQKRSASVRASPGKLCIPGGHVCKGEPYEDAARREFCEEVLHGQQQPRELLFEPLFKIQKTADNDHEFVKVHRTVYAGPFMPDPSEVSECSFLDIKHVLEILGKNPLLFTETTGVVVKEYAQRYL